MSLQSWKEEFYPVDAEDVPKEQAVAHSIRKWQGLLPENLAKHGVEWAGEHSDRLREIAETDDRFIVGASTCALCCHYDDRDNDNADPCVSCPLSRVRGDVECDAETDVEEKAGESSPWRRRISAPAVMIGWLVMAKEWEEKEGAPNGGDRPQ